MDTVLNRVKQLQQDLKDFVLDAEGDLAVSLESFSAAQLARTPHQDMQRRNLVIDRFITEGRIGDKATGKTAIDLFIAEHPELTPADRKLLEGWKRSFVGLFCVVENMPTGFQLMNWTTAKHYTVYQADPTEQEKMARLGAGEILLAQIAPLSPQSNPESNPESNPDQQDWIFSSPWTSFGKLGKPKLAVAIGNFKDNYKKHLYSDAPDLLEEAWRSVEKYHQNFVDFFGSEEVTLPGYQLSKKLTEFQERITKQALEASGLDPSKSLEELAAESGISQAEIAEAAEAMGADEASLVQLMQDENSAQDTAQNAAPDKGTTKMVTPKIELPPHLKKAEQVTVLTHPRWGQAFLPAYAQFKALLEAEQTASTQATSTQTASTKEMVMRHLKDPAFSSFVWYRLAEHYPAQLQAILREAIDRPGFNLQTDLDALLQEFDKSIELELPEIASVPLHLHNLFQEALLEVNKDKSKPKAKKKASSGFQR
jgi:hypothetical protein